MPSTARTSPIELFPVLVRKFP